MLKIKSQDGKIMRRDNKIIILTHDGQKQVITIPGMEESPHLKELKKLPGYKTARREAKRIARSRWDSYWWQKEYIAHNQTYQGVRYLSLRDYITARLLLEQNELKNPVIRTLYKQPAN